MTKDRTPAALGRADVRRCGTLWVGMGEESRAAPPGIPGVRWRAVAADDIETLRRAMIAAGASNPGLAEARVRGGRLGYLCEQAEPNAQTPPGAVLAYGWIARAGDTVDDLGFSLEMPPGEGWIYDCATVPSARGRGLYTALLHIMRGEFAVRGLERGWVGTEPRNWASQRGIARAGFQKVADIDWDREPATVFGVPGFPEAALYAVAMLAGDGEHSRVLPEAGIPWIEAVFAAADGAEPDGMRLFRETFGEQIHWSRQGGALGEEPQVTIRCGESQRAIAADGSFAEFARALGEVAPGLPWLSEATPPA